MKLFICCWNVQGKFWSITKTCSQYYRLFIIWTNIASKNNTNRIYFFRKEFGCFGMNCLYRICTNLVLLVVLMFLFKAVLFRICSGKISCNNNLNTKLYLWKSNLTELTNTQNVKRRIICFVFFGKPSKVCCNILHRWSHLLEEFNKSGGSK